jgi:hypothetical protein
VVEGFTVVIFVSLGGIVLGVLAKRYRRLVTLFNKSIFIFNILNNIKQTKLFLKDKN